MPYNIIVITILIVDEMEPLWERYSNCLAKFVMAMMPEYPWLPWLFQVQPRNLWENHGKYFHYFENLSINRYDKKIYALD
jgi:hypothetical protein